MRNLLLLFLILFTCNSIDAQIFPQKLETNWEFQDETNKIIVINYDLPEFEELRYLKILVRAYVDDKLIPMKSIRGDIGEAVRVGKNKTIQWDWEKDVVEIAGNLRFEVTADNPNPITAESKSRPTMEEPKIPVLTVLGLPLIAGGGLAVTGLITSSGASSDWDGLTEAQKSSDEYSSLNGKYKNGQYLAIGGAAVIIAGVIWYLKEKSAINNLQASRFSIKPASGSLADNYFSFPISTIGLGLTYNF